jgi:His/Glu/Gln/Arg/opine family amino acid ABC transporter permease subunit
MSVLDILINFREGFADGLLVTIKLCLVIWSLGLIAGSLLGILGARWHQWLGIPSRVLSFVLSGIPVLVFLFWLHYPMQAMLDIVIDPFYTAAATLSIINIFMVADIVRGALRDFPRQYLVAAKVCGLPALETVRHIQLPLILRQIIPDLLTVQVNMLQATLFASLISVEEIFRVAQRVNAQIYRPVEIYTALGIFFLMICLKMKYTRDLSER